MMRYNLTNLTNYRKYQPAMKHDLLRRFAYIETCLYWGNGLTAPHLGEIFGIARQNAQKVIEQYRQQYPENILYDRSKKRHIASDEFSPAIINPQTEKYLDYIRGIAAMEHYLQADEWTEIPFETDDQYLKPPQYRPIVRAVLSSIQEERAIHILYRAKSEVQTMLISAHHLVYANYRYHVRAYDHTEGWFRDLVLTRFIEVEEAKETWVSSANDERWIKELTLRFQINPELPAETQYTLQTDYRLGSGTIRTIRVRQAMLGYICREMERVDWRPWVKPRVRIWLDIDGCCV